MTRSQLVRRSAVVAALLVAGSTVTLPARAAPPKPVATHITVTPTSAVVLVKTPVAIAGAVTPAGHGALQLQVERAGKWKSVASHDDPGDGTFAFTYTPPPAFTTTVELRVYRPAILTVVSAGFSPTITIRTATKKFTVTATPTLTPLINGAKLSVTGAFTPTAGGTVALQRQFATGWRTIRTAAATGPGRYALSTNVARGSYLYRVMKNPTTTTATGLSKPFRIGVDAPFLTTTSLSKGGVGVPYTQTLTADGGVPPYTFTAVPLPAGLTLSKAGLISGRPTTPGTTTITATVTDAKRYLGSRAFTLVISPVTVKAWGQNGGLLGNGASPNASTPVNTELPSGSVEAVSDLYAVGVALKTDGTVWAWGAGNFDPGASGNVIEYSSPIQVVSLQDVVAVSSNAYGGLALKADGTVWAWGLNDLGQLGNGTTVNSATPVQVSGLSHVVAIAGGSHWSLALLANGTLMSWGSDQDGALGDGQHPHKALTPAPVLSIGATPATRAVSIWTSWYTGFAILADGTVRAWGDPEETAFYNPNLTDVEQATPTPVPSLQGVTAIEGSEEYALALRPDGTVVAWGMDDAGQYPQGADHSVHTPTVVPGVTDVTAIANGDDAAYALRADGTVLSWGGNFYGELGTGAATGTGQTFPPSVVPGLKNVVGLTGSTQRAFAIVTD